MTSSETDAIIETKSLTIQFGGHVAVDNVQFRMAPNTLKSIIGPNGAGKTTFFNLLTGQYKPSRGQVLFKGRDVTTLGPAERTALGMGRSFQLTNVFANLNVLENVRVAVQSRQRVGFNFWSDYRRFSDLEDEAYDLLARIKLEDKWESPVTSLTHGEKRKLEIAVLLALKPAVLFLDEPTAGMSIEEVPTILEILNDLKEARDRTLLLVEHKMDMIMSLSDTIAVFQEGQLIADGDPQTIYRSKAVQEAYLGGGTQRE